MSRLFLFVHSLNSGIQYLTISWLPYLKSLFFHYYFFFNILLNLRTVIPTELISLQIVPTLRYLERDLKELAPELYVSDFDHFYATAFI